MHWRCTRILHQKVLHGSTAFWSRDASLGGGEHTLQALYMLLACSQKMACNSCLLRAMSAFSYNNSNKAFDSVHSKQLACSHLSGLWPPFLAKDYSAS